MFTGIIDHTGKIVDLKLTADCATLWVSTQFQDLILGESIAVDGVCLTVAEATENSFACQLSPETMKVTIAQNYSKNRIVNVERALSPIDRFGGHFVSGHVDQTLMLSGIESADEFIKLSFKSVDAACQPYLIQKGSVTINGVSLTINTVDADGFDVMLIPHTLEKTNLSALQLNQSVNVEFDMIAKCVAKQMQPFITKEVE